jgi:hypothetical protein
LETACRRTGKGRYGVFAAFAGSSGSIHGVYNELHFGTTPCSGANFFAVSKTGGIIFGAFTADNFAVYVSLVQDGTAELYSLIINKVAVALSDVKGSANRACDSYSG